jgi:beta-barrel assembly-enhancing protease
VKPQQTLPIGLLIWMAVAGYAVYRIPANDQPSMSAPMEMWADALRGAGALTAPPAVQEQKLGARMSATVPVDPPQDPSLQPYVDRVGARVAAQARRKEISYRFTVREDPTLNAFALPGGHVYVNTGLLSFLQSEDELAMVLGHELSHIELRHTAPNVLKQVLSLGYTKYQEFDADEAGVRLATAAGYNKKAAIKLFQRLSAQSPTHMSGHKPRSPVGEAGHVLADTLGGYWQSHPAAEERVRRLSNTIGKS